MKSSDYLNITTSKIKPLSDSTSAIHIVNSTDTSNILNIDTTNNRVGINRTSLNYGLEANSFALRDVDDHAFIQMGTASMWIDKDNYPITFGDDQDYAISYNATNNSLLFCKGNSSSTSNRLIELDASGNLGIGADPSCALDINGYSKFGSDAPKIKMKVYTGVVSGTTGDTLIQHNLSLNKILFAVPFINTGTVLFPPYSNADYPFAVIDKNFIFGNNSALNGKQVRIFVIYEE